MPSLNINHELNHYYREVIFCTCLVKISKIDKDVYMTILLNRYNIWDPQRVLHLSNKSSFDEFVDQNFNLCDQLRTKHSLWLLYMMCSIFIPKWWIAILGLRPDISLYEQAKTFFNSTINVKYFLSSYGGRSALTKNGYGSSRVPIFSSLRSSTVDCMPFSNGRGTCWISSFVS